MLPSLLDTLSEVASVEYAFLQVEPKNVCMAALSFHDQKEKWIDGYGSDAVKEVALAKALCECVEKRTQVTPRWLLSCREDGLKLDRTAPKEPSWKRLSSAAGYDLRKVLKRATLEAVERISVLRFLRTGEVASQLFCPWSGQKLFELSRVPGVYVVAAVRECSSKGDGQKFGFGAGFDLANAERRASLELAQTIAISNHLQREKKVEYSIKVTSIPSICHSTIISAGFSRTQVPNLYVCTTFIENIEVDYSEFL